MTTDSDELESLLTGKGIEGWTETWSSEAWYRQADTLIGHQKVDKNALLRRGDSTWADYEVHVTGALIEGSNLQIFFRVSDDGSSYYAFDWGNVGKVVLSRRDGRNLEWLSVVEVPIQMGRAYDIVVAARGTSISTSIDGEPVHLLTDGTYRTGGVGFNMWHKARVTFRDPRIRHYR
ncbi:MAG: DUF1080 domain-containing protein [Gemmatimonadota bacterium]|nr:DUF1080 domain-containing protein [Gemmatimonadota bacterium]